MIGLCSIVNLQPTIVMSSSPHQLKETGLQQFKLGQYDEALASFIAAATAFATQSDTLNQAEMLNNIGVVHRFKRRYDAAAAALQQAQAQFAQVGDQNRQAQTLANLGELHRSQRAYDEAGRCYSDAAHLFAQINERNNQAEALWALSMLRARQRRWLEGVYIMADSLKTRPRRSLFQSILYAFLVLARRLIGG